METGPALKATDFPEARQATAKRRIEPPYIDKAARFDAARAYRFWLYRKWGDGPTAMFVMLNPSTADENVLDPTIRRCVGFAQREGCGGVYVTNLYAFRATKPSVLFKQPFPASPRREQLRNQGTIIRLAKTCSPVIVAWGNHGHAKGPGIYRKLVEAGIAPMCLGETSQGDPKHPLYVKGDTPLQPHVIDETGAYSSLPRSGHSRQHAGVIAVLRDKELWADD